MNNLLDIPSAFVYDDNNITDINIVDNESLKPPSKNKKRKTISSYVSEDNPVLVELKKIQEDPTVAPDQFKKISRRYKNRLSAQISREKKVVFAAQLQNRIIELEEENSKLKNRVDLLTKQNESLRQISNNVCINKQPPSLFTESSWNMSGNELESRFDISVDSSSYSSPSYDSTSFDSSTDISPELSAPDSPYFGFRIPSPLTISGSSIQSSLFVLLVCCLCFASFFTGTSMGGIQKSSVATIINTETNTRALVLLNGDSPIGRQMYSIKEPNTMSVKTAVNVLENVYNSANTVALMKNDEISNSAMQLFTTYLSSAWLPILKSNKISPDSVALCPYKPYAFLDNLSAINSDNETYRFIIPNNTKGLSEVTVAVLNVRELSI